MCCQFMAERLSMTRVRSRRELVRTFMLEHLDAHPRDIVRVTVERFQITRQAAHRHLHNLVNEKAVVSEGNTRNRVYRLAPLPGRGQFFPFTGPMPETPA